jgi:hypothetical protein
MGTRADFPDRDIGAAEPTIVTARPLVAPHGSCSKAQRRHRW